MKRLYQLTTVSIAIISACLQLTYAEPAFTPSGHYFIRIKPIKTPTKQSRMAVKKASGNAVESHQVSIPKVSLSEKAREALVNHIQSVLAKENNEDDNTSPKQTEEKVFLGMNDLPVLNQGVWGSCATFATTEAIDAYYHFTGSKQISQLCNLELGLALNTGDEYGGWDGASIQDILSQINIFGFLVKKYEQKYGCGGLTAYPLQEDLIGEGMTELTFSERANHKFRVGLWHQLITPALTSSDLSNDLAHAKMTIKQIRAAIRRGHRVVIMLGLPITADPEHNGAIGSYHGDHNVWMLSDDILNAFSKKNSEEGNHALVITGFDDNCITVNENGADKEKCHYVIVRNSWGKDVGDHGNYYVTDLYLGAFLRDAYEIG